jgi:hypothetical protein
VQPQLVALHKPIDNDPIPATIADAGGVGAKFDHDHRHGVAEIAPAFAALGLVIVSKSIAFYDAR